MTNILIIGNGGHARSCIDVIEAEEKYKILGIISNEQSYEIKKYPIIGRDNDLEKLIVDCKNVIIAFGSIKDPSLRIKKYNMLKEIGYKFPIIKSPHAYVSSSAKIGEGSIIMHHSMINSNAVVGKNCIINSKALIEHDVKIGDHVHISTSAVVNGSTQIENETFIGSNAVVGESIKIGKKCIISAGLFINRNMDDNEFKK